MVAALFGGIFTIGTLLGWRAARADQRIACKARHPAGKQLQQSEKD
jgi:hypothetical protein